jgi:nucleoside-diphosphate-sugar epimerase
MGSVRSLAGARVTVTGGAGFLGSHVGRKRRAARASPQVRSTICARRRDRASAGRRAAEIVIHLAAVVAASARTAELPALSR